MESEATHRSNDFFLGGGIFLNEFESGRRALLSILDHFFLCGFVVVAVKEPTEEGRKEMTAGEM